MKCFNSYQTAINALNLDLCPYGLIQYHPSRYVFAPETKEEEIKARMGSHYSKGKRIYSLDYKRNCWNIQFDCSRVIKSVGINPCGGIYMD